ncbi:Zn(2)-C6 fungal-type DNA-binding domain [Lasallia pustulata]|nr:Zn(2)-C6 fungal-type DNA-binding domain [Lasallia pustulata]
MGTDKQYASETDDEEVDGDDPGGEEIEPKVEEVEEALMRDVKPSSLLDPVEGQANVTSDGIATPKRGRGRPRKNPANKKASLTKSGALGRSKTGCITCRKRKKKCGEEKPTCHNCRKNAKVCEGYPPATFWRPGRHRPEEASTSRFSFPLSRDLPYLIDGIENDIDRRFLAHFITDISGRLTIHDDGSNPFKDLFLPMAHEDKGLMHSLMSLAGLHLLAREPEAALRERQQHHFSEAQSILIADVERADSAQTGDNYPEGTLDDPTMAATIVHCLIYICEGTTKGEYRPHLDAVRRLMPISRSRNPEFQQFLYEFFRYHDVANTITTLDVRHHVQLNAWPFVTGSTGSGNYPKFALQPVIEPGAGVLIGVLDGLFEVITKITILRDIIRERRALGQKPAVDYQIMMWAVDIDAAIHAWDPAQLPNTPRWVAAQLYRQCAWVYLHRTTTASRPSPKMTAAVDEGLEYLRVMPPGESTQAVILLPLFLLGCAAFEQRQRPDIEEAFARALEYSRFGNIMVAKQVVKRVWEMMDTGDEKSWDWETIMKDMDIDCLVT